jgi:hypothetical protein
MHTHATKLFQGNEIRVPINTKQRQNKDIKHKPRYFLSDGFNSPNFGGFCGGSPSANAGGNGFNSGVRVSLLLSTILGLQGRDYSVLLYFTELGSVVRRPDSAIHWMVIFSTVVKLLEKL